MAEAQKSQVAAVGKAKTEKKPPKPDAPGAPTLSTLKVVRRIYNLADNLSAADIDYVQSRLSELKALKWPVTQ